MNGNTTNGDNEMDKDYYEDERAEFEATIDIDAIWNKVDKNEILLDGGNTEKAIRHARLRDKRDN